MGQRRGRRSLANRECATVVPPGREPRRTPEPYGRVLTPELLIRREATPRPHLTDAPPHLDETLLAQLDNYAPEHYDPRGVGRGVRLLREAGLLAAVGTPAYQVEGHRSEEAAAAAFGRQLDLLFAVGRGSLPLGRVFEGHVNALELVTRFATDEQRGRWFGEAARGQLFGVWNTEAGEGGLHVDAVAEGFRLRGAKTFCSGVGDVMRPIITGQRWEDGRAVGWQMLIFPMEQLEATRLDGSFWSPLGMQASASHRVDFEGLTVAASALLGQPNDYHRQPHFSGGAIRFAAVQLGGAQALYDHTLALLTSMRRTRDPYQCHRLARMEIALQSGHNWLAMAPRRALPAWHDPEDVVHFANMTRSAALELCSTVLDLCEQAVGARGFLEPKPIQRIYTDLRMYLRQPAPDNALAAVGHRAVEVGGGPLV